MTGFDSSVGIGEESTWAVPVAPSVWVPQLQGSPPSIGHDIAWLKSNAVIAGRRVRDDDLIAQGDIAVTGSIPLELYDRSIGKFFKHWFGGVSTAGPTGSYYDHTFTPGTLTGKGLTYQEGIPDATGTVQPFTVAGMKIMAGEIACSAGEIATVGFDVIGRTCTRSRTVADGATTNASPTVTSATGAFSNDDLFKPISGTGIPASSYIGVVNSATSVGLSSSNTTNTPANATAIGSSIAFTIGSALTAVSYTAGLKPMNYVGGGVSVGGATIDAKSFKVHMDNQLNDSRRFIGSPLVKEPVENGGYRAIDGEITMEFADNTQYGRFVRGDQFALQFVVATDPAAATAKLTATLNAVFTGNKPQGDPGNFPFDLTMPFEALGSTDAAAFTAVLHTTDATP